MYVWILNYFIYFCSFFSSFFFFFFLSAAFVYFFLLCIPPGRWGLEYADDIPCRGVNPPTAHKKWVSWVWHKTAFDGEVLFLEILEYRFSAIIPRFTLIPKWQYLLGYNLWLKKDVTVKFVRLQSRNCLWMVSATVREVSSMGTVLTVQNKVTNAEVFVRHRVNYLEYTISCI